jgi:hypothetical protein
MVAYVENLLQLAYLISQNIVCCLARDVLCPSELIPAFGRLFNIVIHNISFYVFYFQELYSHLQLDYEQLKQVNRPTVSLLQNFRRSVNAEGRLFLDFSGAKLAVINSALVKKKVLGQRMIAELTPDF